MKKLTIPKQISLKAFLAVTFSLLLGVSVLFYVYAQTPTQTFWISGGVYPGAPAYTVWREGSDYFAKDKYGQITTASTNFTDLIQTCIDDASSAGGGIILLMEGEYNPTQCIIPKTNVHIRGETREGVIIRVATGTPDGWGIHHIIMKYYDAGGATAYNMTVSDLTIDTNPLNIPYEMSSLGFQSPTENCRIENVKILGFNGTNQGGISINGGLNDVVTDCIIVEGGIGGSTTCEGLYFTNTNSSIFSQNLIVNMSREGIYIGENNYDNTIIGNNIYITADSGIEVKATAHRNTISTNTLRNCTNGIFIGGDENTIACNSINYGTNGIVVNSQLADFSEGNVISSNTIGNTPSAGISIDTNAGNNTIIGNSIINGGYGIYIKSVNYTVVTGNYVTETNYGIEITGGSNWTLVTGNMIRGGVRGIREFDTSSDYNVITGCIVTDATVNILVVGTNSQCNLCYNGTTWIP